MLFLIELDVQELMHLVDLGGEGCSLLEPSGEEHDLDDLLVLWEVDGNVPEVVLQVVREGGSVLVVGVHCAEDGHPTLHPHLLVGEHHTLGVAKNGILYFEDVRGYH